MPNTSKYNSKLLRAEPAAPVPRSEVRGTANEYWLERARLKRASEQARKRKKA